MKGAGGEAAVGEAEEARGSLFHFVGCAQPLMPGSDSAAYNGTFLSPDDKRVIVDQSPLLPIPVDHGSGQATGYEVGRDEQVGRVTGYFVDPSNQNLMVVGELFHDSDDAKRIAYDQLTNGAWGLSLWTEYDRDKVWNISNKQVTHVGITKHPDLGEHGTWIKHWSHSKALLDRELRNRYLSEPGVHMSRSLRERLGTLRTV